ncbi:signal peptide peptidase SppA [Crocinitomix catalasitica]|uniref:signal peptide peptidase SppA n=1 Tax=Crocinitomix catalasitica TaxID=184607 RepID=UPI000684B376|nr:signal peptide peptidase SppA [Crocinitomix catalasitica]
MNMTFWKTFWASLIASIVAGIVVIGLFFLILSSIVAGFSSMLEAPKLAVEDKTVLHMTLDGQIGDFTYAGFDQTSFQLTKKFGLNEILEGIKIAKTDDKIAGIFLNVDGLNAGMATVKEIRDALEDFKSDGKFVVAYHENYTAKAYYLATVADELHVFPSGMLEFLGLGSELVFLKGALEKLDVEMQIIRGSNNKFKSAIEPLIYDKMSDENRLQTQKYMDALWNEMLVSIGKSRNLSVDRLNEIADSVFIRKSGDAVDYKMADGVKYYDEILDLLSTKAKVDSDKELALLPFHKYAMKKTHEARVLGILDKTNIALIFAEGSIVDGEGTVGEIGGTRLANQIREARMDTLIKAVVLRINSPGGSALASDIIWREVVKTKEVKPVIVSMGDVAASGGYYIACAADTIYAQPNTITGSIGVFGIIPYTGDLFKNKLGVTFDRVQTNQHSILSLNKKLDAYELSLIQGGVDDIYDDFISKVASGRGMTKANVDSIGQGRVWAGKDAIEIGLVDAFGGINTAIADAAKRAGIATEDIRLKYIPNQEQNKFFEFLEMLEEQDETIAAHSNINQQLMSIYNELKGLGSQSTIQARMPYLFWID